MSKKQWFKKHFLMLFICVSMLGSVSAIAATGQGFQFVLKGDGVAETGSQMIWSLGSSYSYVKQSYATTSYLATAYSVCASSNVSQILSETEVIATSDYTSHELSMNGTGVVGTYIKLRAICSTTTSVSYEVYGNWSCNEVIY